MISSLRVAGGPAPSTAGVVAPVPFSPWALWSTWEFDDLTKALYFSVTTSTTLGYGDITLSPQWQLLSTFEAIAGLLLFGASTAFLLALMKNLFDDIEKEKD